MASTPVRCPFYYDLPLFAKQVFDDFDERVRTIPLHETPHFEAVFDDVPCLAVRPWTPGRARDDEGRGPRGCGVLCALRGFV